MLKMSFCHIVMNNAIIVLILSAVLNADSSIIVHTLTKHDHEAVFYNKNNCEWNENNFGIGYQYQSNGYKAAISMLIDSLYQNQYNAFIGKDFYFFDNFAVGINAGTMYKKSIGYDFYPIAFPNITAIFGNISVSAMYIPTIKIGTTKTLVGFTHIYINVKI